MKKVILATAIASMFSMPALANQAQVEDIYKTVTKRIPYTEQVCKTVEVPIYGNKGVDTEGAIVGGLIGGILGNQVGNGSGKEIATGIGAMTGAIMGGKKGNQEVVGYRLEDRCSNVTRYDVQSQEVYSHSIVTFYEDGKRYRVKFQK